jgi:TPR repeat protein
MIAAENGSIPPQLNLGLMLRDEPDPKNHPRAVYWLKRVIQRGDGESARLATRYLEGIAGK